MAELVENAAVFSPPNTRIEVRADRVGTGLVAEVEDRGLGISAEERDEINRRLASSPEFDLSHSDQLGLFVVGQLAARHNIRVSLRESVYGGTTAIVLLPFGVVVREEEAGLPDGQGAGVTDLPSFGLTGRHRQAALLPSAPDTAHRPAVAGVGAQAKEPAAQPSSGTVPIAPLGVRAALAAGLPARGRPVRAAAGYPAGRRMRSRARMAVSRAAPGVREQSPRDADPGPPGQPGPAVAVPR